jgi:hypothetical protein
MNFTGFEHFIANGPFNPPVGIPAFAGISGGRTSGVMAALLDERVHLCFENTGREHSKTLEFLRRLEDAIKRPITWLEWRPPARKGAPPREFGFEVVTYETAVKSSGALFDGLLQALAEHRATKDMGPIVPWPRSRICTAYLKHRTQQKYMESIGVGNDTDHEEYVGLRADEPGRVFRLKSRETQARSYCTPLADANITKGMVNTFWKQQAFDLEIEHDRQGNCGACFLKDHGDISRVLGEDETDAAWWIDLEQRYPGFGGQNFPGYAQLYKERPVRLAIEAALKAGTVPVDDGTLTPKRFKLVVRNEKRYADGERAAFSCACEGSIELADEAV